VTFLTVLSVLLEQSYITPSYRWIHQLSEGVLKLDLIILDFEAAKLLMSPHYKHRILNYSVTSSLSINKTLVSSGTWSKRDNQNLASL
jgi:hypothetical protein